VHLRNRRISVSALIAATTLCVFCHPVLGNVIHVPTDQSTIQSAINAAGTGDTVMVAPGTYFENINFSGKSITLASEQGPQVTIIDGGQLAPVVTFASGEGPQSVLSGLTLQHGRALFASGYNGGGVNIQNASPTITGNIITHNDAGGSGGGISSSFGSPIIKGNTITNNSQIQGWSGGNGGGIYIGGASSAQVIGNTISNNSEAQGSGGGIALFAAGTPTLRNNTISNNSAYSQGGGIWMVNQSDALIVQNLITGNSAPSGGGIYLSVPSGARGAYVISNTVSGNASTQGSAIYAVGFHAQAELIDNILVSAAGPSTLYCDTTYSPNPPIVKSNDVFAISGTAYTGSCAGLGTSNGNISADPKFQSPAAGDYHLTAGSPAIDAGISDPAIATTDLDGNPTPLDGNGDGTVAFDLGCYEAPGTGDFIPPTTTAVRSPAPNASGWNSGNVAVALSATDNIGGTGVKQVQYSLAGSGQTGAVQIVPGNSAMLTVANEGATTVTYNSVDNANNAENTKVLSMKIDKTAPVISGMPAPGCTLSPAKHQLVAVAVLTASDALSGVASFSVTATSNEPDSGTGGGDLPGDIVINGGSVQLRAERAPNGKGRVYTITARATDLAGNAGVVTSTCAVPK
jgi:parallel beta-helix repeat protein